MEHIRYKVVSVPPGNSDSLLCECCISGLESSS